MARARNLKPGFFRNADLVELPFEARLMFAGLWTLADRAGRLEDRPKQIKMELFPADNIDCNEVLNSLADAGMIDRYSVEGKSYIQVTNFTKHQNPHKEEKHSVIPCKPSACSNSPSTDNSASTVQAQCKTDADTVAIGLTPSLLTPESLLPIPSKKPSAEYSAEFEQAWSAYPRFGDTNKKASYKAWNARLKSGSKPEQMIEGVKRYAVYCYANGTEQKFIKQPQTFFGPDEHYKLEWSVQSTSPPKKASVQEERLDTIKQIFGRTGNGTDRQIIDITPTVSIEGDRARIPETCLGVRQSDGG